MIPQSKPRKKKNSSKVNLTISAIVHGALIVGLIYFAARNGFLGKKLKEITVYKVEKEKPPEPPQQKKIEPPKEQARPVDIPKVAEAPQQAAPPAASAPVVAPASSDVADFNFSDGAKAVNSESDPVQLYKGYIEYSLRSKWNRPENLPDDNYAVEVAISVDKQGNLSTPRWLKGSGDPHWDDSVKDVFKIVDHIDRRPPTNFPSQVTIRFDVQEETEPVMQ
jgi:outer membrane biosynthesis protein TonB